MTWSDVDQTYTVIDEFTNAAPADLRRLAAWLQIDVASVPDDRLHAVLAVSIALPASKTAP